MNYQPRILDEKGRCCGRKPLKYKRDGGPHYFCVKCDRAYSLDTNKQIENWAWALNEDGTFRTRIFIPGEGWT